MLWSTSASNLTLLLLFFDPEGSKKEEAPEEKSEEVGEGTFPVAIFGFGPVGTENKHTADNTGNGASMPTSGREATIQSTKKKGRKEEGKFQLLFLNA